MNLKLFLLTTIVSTVFSASESPDARIVGGSPVEIKDYPFVVSIVHIDPETGVEEQKCVGSIISSWHLLTTAHCFENANVEDFKLRAGSSNSLEGGTMFDIYYLNIHPDYAESPRTADIAIIQMYEPIPIVNNIGVVYIPPQETHIPDGYSVKALGWGYAGVDGPKVENLKSFQTYTIPQQQCIDAFSDDNTVSIYDQVICTRASNRSLCHGDSGAPLVIGDVLVGIATYTRTCDDTTPDVFTRIDRHTGWILQEAVPPYGRSTGIPVRVADFTQ